MDNLKIEATQYTPDISLNTNGEIKLTGKSYPENTFEFYRPIIDWLEEYFEEYAQDKTVVDIEITYFNSSTSKVFFDIFDIFDKNTDNSEIVINWIYDEEDDSSLESGEDLQEDFENLSINLVIK